MTQQFRLPAEWEKQSGVLITWPHKHSDWVVRLPLIETFFIALAKAITSHEKLLLVTYDEALRDRVRGLLTENGVDCARITFFVTESNDSWARDFGPITLSDGKAARILDFAFNAWGGKYRWEKDNLVNGALLKNSVLHCQESMAIDFVLEGGSIDCDGQGTILSTKQCLLNKNRNPNLSQAEIESVIKQQLNADRILWLSEGMIMGDDTDSHIDMLARFTDENTIVYTACDNEQDPHYQPLLKMKAELEGFRTRNNQPYKLIGLPIPAPILNAKGDRLPASYANFLIINGAVLLPVYADKKDSIAIDVLQSCFPDRKVIPIDARVPINQGGSLHCLTMQLIDGVL